MVVFDPTTKKSNGFGFVTLDNAEDLDTLLAIDPHYVNGVKVDCKTALNRKQAKDRIEDERQRKLFVGGLPNFVREAALYKYFSKFGRVEKAYHVKDHNTGKPRGFGFVIFAAAESYIHALQFSGQHIIQGIQISLREPIDRSLPTKRFIKSWANQSEDSRGVNHN